MKHSLNRIQKLVDKGRYKEATQALQSLLRNNDSMADVQNLLGVVYHYEGQYSKAIQKYNRAYEINPNYTEPLLNLTILYNDLGQYDKGKDVFYQIDRNRSQSEELDDFVKGRMASAYAEIGNLYYELHKYDEAINEYKKALSIKKDMVDVKVALAESFLRKNQNIKAIAELEEAKKLNPNYFRIYVVLGMIYHIVGNNEKSTEQLHHALKLSPKDRCAKSMLSTIEAKKI